MLADEGFTIGLCTLFSANCFSSDLGNVEYQPKLARDLITRMTIDSLNGD